MRNFSSRFRKGHVWQTVFLAVYITFGSALVISADTPEQIDRLAQQWLDTERQASRLEADWRDQEPILEQRLALLRAEKQQLQSILKQSNDSQGDVEVRRAELLARQAQLEKQQQELVLAVDRLLVGLEPMNNLLPEPVRVSWNLEQGALTDDADVSLQLQVALAKLSSLVDFNDRITVNEASVIAPDGSSVLVKQFYLGVGAAWFSSADGKYAGWGQADTVSWNWHFYENIDADEIAKAIAIFERHEQADFVRLPIMLESQNASKSTPPLENTEVSQ